MPLFLLLLLLPATCSSLHIFLSHSSSHVYTRQSFSLLLDGDDCPYTPCYFAVFLNGTEHSTRLYQNTVKRVSVTVTIPGQVTTMVRFSDTENDGGLPYGSTVSGDTPTVFTMPVLVEKSEYCNSVKFSINGTFVKSVSSIQEKVDIHIYNGKDEDITAHYFYSGVRNPTVQLKNTTTQFSLELERNHTLESWVLVLNKKVLLAQVINGSVTPQNEWILVLSFPAAYFESCLIQKAYLSVSMLSSVFTNASMYLGEPVIPYFADHSILNSQTSSCSRNLQVVFQSNSSYFGIFSNEQVTWYRSPQVDGKDTTLLTVLLLPVGLILVTSRGVVTVTESGTYTKVHSVSHATVQGRLQCPVVCSNRVLITLNQDTVLDASCPYTDWKVLPISPDSGCSILDTFYDVIRSQTVTTQTCVGGSLFVNSTAAGEQVKSLVSGITSVVGVHWEQLTSDLYLYGSHVLHSSTRGRSFSTLLVLNSGDLVRQLVSGSFTGDLFVVTNTGRLFLSNVGVHRFVELHTAGPTSPLSFFSLDHSSQPHYTVLASTSLVRYGIPTKSLFSSDYHATSPLFLELVARNRARITFSDESDRFLADDVGKIFQLSEDRGSGQIVEVSNTHDLSSAVVNIIKQFVKASPSQGLIVLQPASKKDTVLIGAVGRVWSTNDIRSCVVVLYCTSFIVTDFVSETSIIAVPLDATKAMTCLGLIDANKWFLVNLDPHASTFTAPYSSKFTVTSVTTTVTLTTAAPDLSSDLVGKVLTVQSDRLGIVHSVVNGALTFKSDRVFTVGEEFESWEVSFSDLGSGLLTEGSYPRQSVWTVSEPQCEVVFLDDDLAHLYHPVSEVSKHIDTGKEVVVGVRVADRREFPISAPRFDVQFDNRDRFHFYTAINTTTSLTQMNLHLAHNNSLAGTYTPVLITPADHTSSLRCDVPALLYTALQDCGPQARIVLKYPHIQDPQQFLLSEIRNPDGDTLLKTLPVNYRPPSIHGREISSSPHVYNVDPSVPIPRTEKAISKESHVFKQCAGAATAEECGCTDEMRISGLEVDSDCKQNVYTLSYTTIFHPELYIVRFGQPDERLNNSYLISEINGRKEFEIFRTDQQTPSANCNFTDCSIAFLGSELFHIRISVISDTICSYETEFLIYVVDVPLSKTLHNTIATYVVTLMFLVILIYYMCTKEREKNLFKEEALSPESSCASSPSPTTKL